MRGNELEHRPFFKPEHWGHTVGHFFIEPIGAPVQEIEIQLESGRILQLNKGRVAQIVFVNGGREFEGEEKLVDLRGLPWGQDGLPIIEDAVLRLNERGVTPVIEDNLQILD